MNRRTLRTLLGLSMVALGLIQVGLYSRHAEWVPTGLGLAYAVIGVVYLWAEVSRVDF